MTDVIYLPVFIRSLFKNPVEFLEENKKAR